MGLSYLGGIMNDIIVYKEDSTFQEDIALIKDATTKVFLISGKILQNIQDNKKYKQAGYKTFTEAVECELGMKRSNAYELMDAARSYENLSGAPDIFPENILPTAVAQLRPIAKLSAPEQIDIWKTVSKGKIPTAKEVQAEVDRRKNKEPKIGKEVTNNDKALIEDYTNVVEELTKAKEYIKELEERIKNLEYSNELLNAELLKSMGIEAPPQKSVVEEVILLTRPEVDAAIAHYGNDIQKGVLKDNKKNSEVFRVFCGVRSRYLENNPSISLPIRLREAVGCVDDSENNTEHIPKKILRA